MDVKLNDDNYKILAGSVRMIFCGLGLLFHIDGTLPLDVDSASSAVFGDLSSFAPPPHLATRGSWRVDMLMP